MVPREWIAKHESVAVDAAHDWLQGKYKTDHEFLTTVTAIPGSSWLMVTFNPVMPYEADAGLPRQEQVAIWRATGAIHTIDNDGAVIDPPVVAGAA